MLKLSNFKVLLLVFSIVLVPIFSSFSKELAGSSEFSSASTDEKINILAEEIERLRNQELFGGEIGSVKGFGPAASKVYNTSQGLRSEERRVGKEG